jgi:cytochrome c-type biogenesis protein CcmH
MLLWLLFALMTAAVLAVLLRPLVRPDSAAPATAESIDVAVYKDQLAEIEADAARGLLDGAEAESARREIARRLLARSGSDGAIPASTGATSGSARLAMVLAGLVPIATLATYLILGSPDQPARPFVANAGKVLAKAPVEELVAKVEARLASNPGDGQGWDVIAPVYFRLQRFGDAADAYGRALQILGDTTQRLAGFAEATIMENNGIVTEPARLAYEKLLKREPGRLEPRFWLALAKEQDGKRSEAASDYKAILAEAPADAPWRSLVVERLAAVDGQAAAPPVLPPARGPSADDVKAADQMSDKDRTQMIAGMVDGLAKRLEANPQDLPGWTRLVQSYVVLGEKAKAAKALGDARRHLAGDAAAVTQLTDLAKSLGLGS